MKVTAQQLWAAVMRGETDAVIAVKLDMAESVVRRMRHKFKIPSCKQMGTLPAVERETTVQALPEDATGILELNPLNLPFKGFEDRWHARFNGLRFQDHPEGRQARFRMAKPATHVPSQSSAA